MIKRTKPDEGSVYTKEDADRYATLVSDLLRRQELMLRHVFKPASGKEDMELDSIGLAAYAAAAAGMIMSLAGAFSGDDEELYALTLNASVGTFMACMNKAPEAYEEAVANGLGQKRH